MDFVLDMRTVFILLLVGHLYSAVLILAYWRPHIRDLTINAYFYSKCAQVVAWFFLVLIDGIPNELTISVANSLLFLGCSLEAVALLSLLNKFDRMAKLICIVWTSVAIAGFQVIIIFHNDEITRVAFASIALSLMILFPAYYMVHRRTTSILMKTMGYLLLCVAAAFLLRAIAAFIFDYAVPLFTPGIYQSILFLSLFLFMIAGNTGFILLLKERTDEELLRLASYDDLTHTLNRRTFIAHTKISLTAYARKEKPISLLLLDIDQFKMINDTYGHDAGDRVLQDVTERIKLLLGSGDLFARFGGDEFAILLPGQAEIESDDIAEQIRQTIEHTAIGGLPLTCTMSIGVLTAIPNPHTLWEELYHCCDRALYGAKENGRNVVFRNEL